ncbi:MAG: hypothetical protein JWN87_2901, partial [Frankiales bacterium]|nr:hypothetical protein [Frankiales bacterium]
MVAAGVGESVGEGPTVRVGRGAVV